MDFCTFTGNSILLCAFIGRTDRSYHRLGGTRSGLREPCVLSVRVKAKSSVIKIGEAF